MLSATAGEFLLTERPLLAGATRANVLPGGLLGAFGLGLALVPATIVAVQGVPRALSGLASGVLNTSRFIGAALGLAVLSTLAANHTSLRDQLRDSRGRQGASPTASSSSSSVGALFCLVGAVAAVVLLRPQRAEAARSAPAHGRGRAGVTGSDATGFATIAARAAAARPLAASPSLTRAAWLR